MSEVRVGGRGGWWFVLAGVLVAARAAIELAEPAYYDPETLLDFVAATLTSVAWLVTAVALARWWPAKPARGGSFLLLIAAIAVAVSAVGNFIEDVLGIPAGEALFTYGGMVGAVSILVLGVSLLSFGGGRWAGVLLLLFIAGSTFPDDGGEFLSGASLVVLGFWILRSGAASRPSITA
ncbi:MAG TPA: hypothetical protein VIW46_14165 [Acidimicrobiia bacterium]